MQWRFKGAGPGDRLPGVQLWRPYLLVLWPWDSSLSFGGLLFPHPKADGNTICLIERS